LTLPDWERKSPNTVDIRPSTRYKPDDEDAHETNQWGYTETEPLPALRITDLTETEADLVEAFVPVAVDEAGGFADFRETATKTNSLVDRLRKLTLSATDDVRVGLASYTETVEHAEELDATTHHDRTGGSGQANWRCFVRYCVLGPDKSYTVAWTAEETLVS
jgi:hypothetical protein